MKSNWSNNITFQPAGLESPVSIEHLQNIVQQNSKVKFIGAGHSFNTIADTDGVLVALDDLPCLMQIHVAESKVSVSGNTKLGVLADYLHSHGYAIPNLPSLPHITVAGAVATGTHGSGITNQPIAGEVAAMRIVTALGDMVQFKAGNEASFAGKPVHLGMLGFIAELDLRIVPTFEISQTVILDANWQRTLDDLDLILGSAYSVSIFTEWRDPDRNQIWFKAISSDQLDAESINKTLKGRVATENMHPIAAMASEACTEQLGKSGPWHHRLPHFKMEFQPSAGDELQSEYMVPFRHAREVLKTIGELKDKIGPLLLVSEIRTMSPDHCWMSPAQAETTLAIHFTWRKMPEQVLGFLPELEEKLSQFHARPHWGKLYCYSSEYLRSVYPDFENFRDMACDMDPTGKFRNAYLDRIFG